MKHKIETKEEKPKFETIRLVIDIESEEDLIELWHRFNFGEGNIQNYNPIRFPKFKNGSYNYDIWKSLEDLVRKFGIGN